MPRRSRSRHEAIKDWDVRRAAQEAHQREWERRRVRSIQKRTYKGKEHLQSRKDGPVRQGQNVGDGRDQEVGERGRLFAAQICFRGNSCSCCYCSRRLHVHALEAMTSVVECKTTSCNI